MTRTRSGLLPALVAASGIAINCAHAPPPELPAPRAPGSPQVEAGQRVRMTVLTAFGLRTYIGNITALSADSVTYAAGRRTVAVSLYAVQELEVSRGHRESPVLGRVLAGAGKGALPGAVIIVALGVACGDNDYGCVLPGAVAFLHAVRGAVRGGIHGASSYPGVWERVPLDPLRRLRIGVVPQPRGRLSLGASIRS